LLDALRAYCDYDESTEEEEEDIKLTKIEEERRCLHFLFYIIVFCTFYTLSLSMIGSSARFLRLASLIPES
jgi:hypothetical protein